MKNSMMIRVLTAICVMFTGLAVLLTLVHAFLVGAAQGYSLDGNNLWYVLKGSGLLKWMLLGLFIHAAGLIMLVQIGNDAKQAEQKE